METKEFDLFNNIDLSDDDKEYFKYSDMVNEIIIQLITRRLNLNMSQRDLAKITGIKQPMIARIEKFDSIPRLDTIVKMAYALGLSLVFKMINDNSNNMSIGIIPYHLDNKFNNDNNEMILSENATNYNKKKRK
ncbi:MAG: helix-turn-helix transcriptional regulator [Acholeplasmatales bacterium]|nr:helix-turn-helix transcriptional regulator [Acholeplasmatales bacterium]